MLLASCKQFFEEMVAMCLLDVFNIPLNNLHKVISLATFLIACPTKKKKKKIKKDKTYKTAVL